MERMFDVETMRRRAAEAAKRISLAQGEMNGITARMAELTTTVGLAKGRLEKKADVELFIEELQAEAHSKRVGDYEKLLTALVTDVLPGEKPVGFLLEIERGQPSLDIVSRLSADLMEDIFEDEGGAKTNIVVLGLRMASVVLSKMRRFIVLDEPDCWVMTERIPAFYSVVKDAGRKLGMQCFVISHHDTANFAEGIAIARLSGRPDAPEGVVVENNPRPHRWTDDEDGLRFIRLVNFQAYRDTRLDLGPGVNALIGENNKGKSCFVRACRAVFYGESRDTLIRRGEKSATVEIGLRGGHVLQWTRHAKRNPTWRLLGPDGVPVHRDFDTSSRTVPQWVVDQVGIGPIMGLDPHVVKQKSPIFLLDKPGSTKAAVLAIGQEASHIRDMVRAYKKMCDEDSQVVKTGESEMSRLMTRERMLATVVAHADKVERIEGIVSDVSARVADAARAEKMTAAAEAAVGRVGRIRRVIDAMSGIPTETAVRGAEAEARENSALARMLDQLEQGIERNRRNALLAATLSHLPSVQPTLAPSAELLALGKAVKDGEVGNAKTRRIVEALAKIPAGRPELIDTTLAVAAAAKLDVALKAVAKTKADIADTRQNILRCEHELSALVDTMGHTCPVCGNGIEDARALLRHKETA